MQSYLYFTIRTEKVFKNPATLMRVSCAVLLLLAISCSQRAPAADSKAKATRTSEFSDANFDPATDVHALDEYRDAIAQLLKQENFAELDNLADAARTGKTRFSGGGWKLRNIYIGLTTPRPGHPTQEDWEHHFELLERWRTVNSSSITATIVLAESYVRYAWDARGDGFADSVSESGWKLFGERMSKAKTILDQASDLANKDPNWYVSMQQIAQGQGWNRDQTTELLKRATAFEPGYQYYYRIYADHLQPKWNGQEGDVARFAEATADKIGGPAGDILYFQIADAILCACQESEFGHFSWSRMHSGFAALEQNYGPSMMNLNSFALMASKSNDWVVADAAFKRIGDNYNQELWTSEAYFKRTRNTAAQAAPMQAQAHTARQEAEANVKSKEGAAYSKELEPKLASMQKACVQELNGDEHKSELFVQIGKNGSADNAHTELPPDHLAYCVMRALYASYANKETPFPAPPHAPYWVIVELDPATLAASK
jgi:hypothetical protein